MNVLFKNILLSSAHTSNKQVIQWWERRRPFYNTVMLAAGSLTILLALLLHEISFGDLINTFPPILIFALSANLFYTLGWMMEIVCRKFIQEKALVQKAGIILFIGGIIISVLFTFAIDITLLTAFFFG